METKIESKELLKNEVNMEELKKELLDSVKNMVFDFMVFDRTKTHMIQKIKKMQSLEDYVSIANEIKLGFRRYTLFRKENTKDLFNIISFKCEVEDYLFFQNCKNIRLHSAENQPNYIEIYGYYPDQYGDIHYHGNHFLIHENINYTKECLVLRNFTPLHYYVPFKE